MLKFKKGPLTTGVSRKMHRPRLHPLILVLLVLVLLVITGFVWYRIASSPLSSATCAGEQCATQTFVIKDGESSQAIADHLEKTGLIRSALAFRLSLYLEHRSATLKAGSYTLSPSYSVSEIINIFDRGVVAKTITVRFDPGETLFEIKQELQKHGYSSDEIDAALTRSYDHPLLATKPATASLEGYIYGDTYEFYATTPASEILIRTFDQMYSLVKKNQLTERFAAAGLSLHEGIVLASVVQREAGSLKDDMPQVAQVFLLRLKSGIPLGSDAVIAYYADQQNPNRDKTDTSYLTTTPCPWNSRRCAGLPPSGVSNPGEAALLSVARPASGSYLYFLTGDDGAMHYAHTEAEHNANIKNYCQNLCKLL